MDLKQLRAVITVAEVGGVTRAAELLHLVQPAVTRQIRGLERELGVTLFERTRQGMRPTEAGTKLIERARRALTELDRARAEIQPAPGEITGIVTVGLLESSADLLAERLVAALAHDHPGIELRVLTGYSSYLQQWLDDGDVDVSLLYDLAAAPPLNARPLVREKLWVVAPPSAGLRPDEPVPFAEVARHPLVMPAAGSGLRALVDAAAAKAGERLDITVQTNSMRLQKLFVLGGHGWTVLPGIGIAADVRDGTLTASPLRDPEVWRALVLGTSRAARSSPAVTAVATLLTTQVHATVHEGRWPSALTADTPPASRR
ncbi:DNA-binding transcriptional LysR family regulator [Actinocorallia herbida]|uniref:DNA-binding transcriptional LysR family regulator n=1 Tax=Actinocorallia herbida TaxID=58109 RepID=A0A3N1CW39_9ACTN|nr:LysR family transcriptional regulator [Actinocorallia herbida]ROO85474.1 DNA-binding transcriptional LysR family regulator [Actinocorallia herbida]